MLKQVIVGMSCCAALSVGYASQAHACKCKADETRAATKFKRATDVVRLEVKKFRPSKSYTEHYVLEVVEVFKGQLKVGDTLKVKSQTSCDHRTKKGAQWVLFLGSKAEAWDKKTVRLHKCGGRSVKLGKADALPAKLRKYKLRQVRKARQRAKATK